MNEVKSKKKSSILVNLDEFTPVKEQRIFFGKYNGFQRYDVYKYPFSKTIERSMRQSFWTPEEISLVSDRTGFNYLPKYVQEIFINNLLFQTFMDSVQNRGIDNIMSELVTMSEWEAVFKTHAYFELIHSLSYSHIIREMFSSDSTSIFDRIYENEEIKGRTEKEISAYDNMRLYIEKKVNLPQEQIRQDILELLVRIFFLEGLKFYISFMITYKINETYKDAINGVVKLIKLINFDEDMHVSVVGGLINILKIKKEEGFVELFTSGWFKKMVTEVVSEIVEDEIKWGRYLLSFGPISGLTEGVFRTFMEYFANERLSRIGLEPMYQILKRPEIVEWFDIYKDINKDNTAQQEATALNYNVGTMEFDYSDKDLNKILNDLLNRKAKTEIK